MGVIHNVCIDLHVASQTLANFGVSSRPCVSLRGSRLARTSLNILWCCVREGYIARSATTWAQGCAILVAAHHIRSCECSYSSMAIVWKQMRWPVRSSPKFHAGQGRGGMRSLTS
jgi:hypothetical protein